MFTKAAIEKFFGAEKSDSLALIIIGITAILLGLLFIFYYKTNWLKGFGIPLLVVGIIQFTSAFVLYKTCDENRKKNVYAFDMNRDELKNIELPRIAKINNRLLVQQYLEITFLLIGAGVVFVYRNNSDKQFWMGLGLAIALQALIILTFDFIRTNRVVQYTIGLHSIIDKN